MCRCNPNIRTPFCGKEGCKVPPQVEPVKVEMPINKAIELAKVLSMALREVQGYIKEAKEAKKWKTAVDSTPRH